ncbi:MAG: hypothetical protein ABFD69_00420 [Candidatus Sumerlaeia bacterium]
MRIKSLYILPWLAAWLCTAYFLSANVGSRRPEMFQELNLGNSVLAGQDTLSHDYPASWWGWSQIRKTGRIPLWNPAWFGGEPFVASQTFMPFYPPGWLSAFLSYPLAFNIQYPLHLLLAALAMAWACRRRGLGWIAAGLAGLSFGFGGHLATLVGPGHIQKLQTLAWLPIVTTGMRELAGDRPRRGIAPFAVGLALQVTAGHLQIVWLTLGTGLLESLAVFVSRFRNPQSAILSFRNPQSAIRNLAWGAVALAAALGLSAIFWVPTAEFARLSNREGKLSWEDETRGSLPPEEAFEFALPRLLGDSVPGGRGAYLGRYGESAPGSKITLTPERVVSDYVGAGVLVFALVALISGFMQNGGDGISVRSSNFSLLRNNRALGYILLAAAALVLSMGRYIGPVYKFALVVIPGLSHFRSPSTMMAVFAYAMTTAAAFGVDDFIVMLSTRNARRIKCLTVVLLVALIVSCIVLMSLRALNTPGFSGAAMNQMLHPLAQILLAMFLMALSIRNWPQNTRIIPLLIIFMTLVWGRDLINNAKPFWSAEPVAPYHAWLTSHWALERWAREEVPVRYIQLGNELSNQALTLSDYASFRQVGSAHGYHPVAYGRYFDLLNKLGFTHPNFARLFGMQYILAPASAGTPPAGWQAVDRHGDMLLLHKHGVQYIRQVRHVKVVPSWKDVLDRLAQPGFNPYESTTITHEDAASPKLYGRSWAQRDMHLQPRVFAQGPGLIDLRLMATASGLIELAEPAAPGWRLWSNSEDVSNLLSRLDGYFLGVWVPAGQSAFRLEYDPMSQVLGTYISLLTLSILAFFIAFHFRVSRAFRG